MTSYSSSSSSNSDSSSCDSSCSSECCECKKNKLTNSQKWWLAILFGTLFAIFSSNFVYRITNEITCSGGLPGTYGDGGHTGFGILLHTVIFIFLTRLVLIFV